MKLTRRAGIGVYAGSFDPPTLGHKWVIEEATRILGMPPIVVVAVNPEKPGRFDPRVRVDMLIGMTPGPVEAAEGRFLLAEWAYSRGFSVLVRGVRSARDFEYEAAMSAVNRDVCPGVSTMFLVPPRELREVSSSLVMGLVGLDGWENVVSKYVTADVLEVLKGWKK